jgi:glutathione S-transferase
MKLYYSPLACSMASHITLLEAGAADVERVRVDPKTKTTETGADYLAINPLGQVPVLELDDGQTLTENAAILPFLADRYPAARLAPTDPIGRSRLMEWIGFVSTELHKVVFTPQLDPRAADEVKAYAAAKAAMRLAHLDGHLEGREWLLDEFSVADAYLFAVLNWTRATGTALADYPAIRAFVDRAGARPSVAQALAEEAKQYFEALAKAKAA